ncbi:hypothetical protein RMATCC62417_15049 [Rhizopus microsporus]|nr:hypothetical protein RMATCC62417_15049 [Rhizopus microsporus]
MHKLAFFSFLFYFFLYFSFLLCLPSTYQIYNAQEEDGVFFDGMRESVETVIKREALRLHPEYFALKYDEKDLVELGFNSTLDLSRSQDASQARLFGKENWRKLKEMEKFGKADLRDARAYAYKSEMKSTRFDEADLFGMYARYLEVLEYHEYLFDKDIDVTETDLTVKMWGGLFEKLFRQTKLRCKWDGSVGDSSRAAGSSGFKVDLRVIKDTLSRRSKEADAANMETARMGASIAKTSSDKVKLFIESKCVLDRLARENPERTGQIAVPALQIVGNKVILFPLRLAAPGLYVGVKEESAAILASISHIKRFLEAVKLLYKLKEASLDVANISLQGYDSNSNNDNNSNSSSRKSSWLRGI